MSDFVEQKKTTCQKCLPNSIHVRHQRKIQTQQQTGNLVRDYSSQTGVIETDSWINTILKKIGFRGKMKYKKSVLRVSAVRIYASYFKFVDPDNLMKELDLPDTFNSWYRITELHLWLLAVRLSSEGDEGQFLLTEVVKLFWTDVEEKMRKLGGLPKSTMREGLSEYSEMLHGSLFAYDEGLLGDDLTLAGVVWFSLFEKECDDAQKLEQMVRYIRKQVEYLHSQPHNQVIEFGLVSFLPLYENSLDDNVRKAKLREICGSF